MRIDWFDGTITEDSRPSTDLEEVNVPEPTVPLKKYTEKKLMGFKHATTKVKPILESLRSSVDGLMSEHMEQFSESLFQKMDQVEERLSYTSTSQVAVAFHNPVSKNIFFEPYLMIESEVFFEPYHRVLKVLKEFGNHDIPMQKYIVDVQSNTNTPGYLTSETIYSVPINKCADEISFNVLDTNSWPRSEQINLDDSQMEAYRLALTREFAVIQGPPGTGKTYIGIKVATTLLKNLSLEGTPMLLICYTNHALDQFLEGILNVTKNIIRLGSQSKSEKLEPYALHNLRAKNKSKYSYLYANKRIELEKIFKEMMEVQSEIEKCDKEILTYETVKPYLKTKSHIAKSHDEDPILKWLFGHLENESIVESVMRTDDLDDWDKQVDKGSHDSKTIESCFSENWALKEIDSMLYSIKYLNDVTHDKNEIKKMANKFETSIDKMKKRLDCFKEYLNRNKNENNQPTIEVIDTNDLYSLNVHDKWKLYFHAVNSIKEKLLSNINDLHAKHESCNQELDEIATLVDAEVVKTARVVGATTTTAARRHDLLRTLRSPIAENESVRDMRIPSASDRLANLTGYTDVAARLKS
ncbi:NFX1-type zinc finger-containing protein 1 [Eumeta japonica]|uniref:NFX1-type zinc finger-containing protein 1 n=1 Tax=Eumeta variegata TaxID=151549 RepID=A0A4C1Z798_EUMVA|nr:NFX1-type zinc finger-containing protein 1 [Eumeta japonica]